MDHYITKYGELKDIDTASFYADGTLLECSLNSPIYLSTPYGTLIPQYTINYRKRNSPSCYFYPDGNLQKLALEDQTEITTPIGILPAELITFYRSGNIKRIFPLNGKLSAYWDEADEYNLADKITLNLIIGKITASFLSLYFYENSNIKSLTIWPNEVLNVMTPLGNIKARIGMSFYSDGKLKSIEPATPFVVSTPIGNFMAFDKDASGINGDSNSLLFAEDGSLRSFATSSNTIKVIDNKNIVHFYTPQQILDPDEEEIAFQPVKVTFIQNQVLFNDKDFYELSTNTFIIQPYMNQSSGSCSNCATCTANCRTV